MEACGVQKQEDEVMGWEGLEVAAFLDLERKDKRL